MSTNDALDFRYGTKEDFDAIEEKNEKSFYKVDNDLYFGNKKLNNPPGILDDGGVISINRAGAVGVDSIAIGRNSADNPSLAEASGAGSFSMGANTTASANRSFAFGFQTQATAPNSAAFGYQTKATLNNSFAEGYFTEANGYGSHAEGGYTTSEESNPVRGTLAIGNNSHAEGCGTTAEGNQAHSEGYKTLAKGNNSHAEGSNTTATGGSAHAEGGSTYAAGAFAHAEGGSTRATGSGSHAEGSATTATHDGSHSEGMQTYCPGAHSHAEGYMTTASGDNSHAEGGWTYPSGMYSHAEGQRSRATGNATHAEGYMTTAAGADSHAEGYKALSFGSDCHAEGCTTYAFKDFAHAEGIYTTAWGETSHSEGRGSVAAGEKSHAEGFFSSAIGLASHVEGGDNINGNCAIGESSHAEGRNTTAYGTNSHAEGFCTIASGRSSHAEGGYTQAGYFRSFKTYKEKNNLKLPLYELYNNTSWTFSKSSIVEINQAIAKEMFNFFTYIDNTSVSSYTCVATSPTITDCTSISFCARINTNFNGNSSITAPGTVAVYLYRQGGSNAVASNSITMGSNDSVKLIEISADGLSLSSKYYFEIKIIFPVATRMARYSYNILISSCLGASTQEDNYCHAEGYSTQASGPYSHAQGKGSIASSTASCATGYFGKADTEYSFAHGGKDFVSPVGTTSLVYNPIRKDVNYNNNVFYIDKAGNVAIAGSLFSGGWVQNVISTSGLAVTSTALQELTLTRVRSIDPSIFKEVNPIVNVNHQGILIGCSDLFSFSIFCPKVPVTSALRTLALVSTSSYPNAQKFVLRNANVSWATTTATSGYGYDASVGTANQCRVIYNRANCTLGLQHTGNATIYDLRVSGFLEEAFH